MPKSGISKLDEALSVMEPKLELAANRIKRNLVSGAPIIVRFHNDGDGASGAIALYKAIESIGKTLNINPSNCLWTMNKGVAYTNEALSYDIMRLSQYRSSTKPVLCIIDFGTLKESEPALEKAKEKMDIIWIDHHPVYEGFKNEGIYAYINPWNWNFDSSITAGSLACALASKMSGTKTKSLIMASLISDHSEYAAKDPESDRIAVVLDALTTEASSKSSNITPKSLLAVLDDEASSKLVYTQAKAQMDEAVSDGLKHMKTRRIGAHYMAILDYSRIAERYYSYVRHGRFTSFFSDAVESKLGPSVTIVYNKGLISIRVSKELSKPLGLLSIIEKMKNEIEYISNGGGHNEAASIKLDDDNSVKEFLALFSKNIEERISG